MSVTNHSNIAMSSDCSVHVRSAVKRLSIFSNAWVNLRDKRNT